MKLLISNQLKFLAISDLLVFQILLDINANTENSDKRLNTSRT